MNKERIQKDTIEIVSLHDADDSVYWLSRSPADRIEAIEFMRRVMFGNDRVSARLQRVLTITELKGN
ncbi:MAG: hypothetical protein GXP53_11915 [Deltaproteobacteria bacterium]|nr:hypothetical protein [Deltaproteobacteria bacterium]